jgi:pyruvate/2-oxoglutarate/acetoin dehydrogenase E1 component
MRNIFYIKALQEALIEEMTLDPSVVLMGEDIGEYGGCFGVTRGLQKRFTDRRVVDLPMSETSFVGLALGAALTGLRPVVEIMFMDFITLCSDGIVNHASKLGHVFGSDARAPLVIRTAAGAGKRYGSSHSQSLESMFMNVPGLKIAAPSTAADAKGLLKSAIRDDGTVLFIENKHLYWTKGDVPDGECLVPLGRAAIRRSGRDVTLVAYSRMVDVALAAAEDLSALGIDAEVLDLRSLAPLDVPAILASVAKTGRLVTLEEGYLAAGVGAEVAALAAEQVFSELRAPVMRLACEGVPIPYSPALEDAVLPDKAKVVAAARACVEFKRSKSLKWKRRESLLAR